MSAYEEKFDLESRPFELVCDCAGVVTDCDARIIGEVIRDLGGGRTHKDASINHDVGLDRIAKPGDRVAKGSVLCRVHGVSSFEETTRGRLRKAFAVG
jgi:thymidine phosphorylase